MNLFKTLLISLALGWGLSYFKDVDIDYQAKCVSMSLIYLFSSLYCYKYIAIELSLRNSLYCLVISLLCICMIISCWFNFLFANKDIYYMLIDIRYYNSFSWRTIYFSVELLALFIVGKNAILHLWRWFNCRYRRFDVIIEDNSNIDSGR